MENFNKSDAFGILKFNGKLIIDGGIDLKTAGESLLGLNEALNFFIKKEYPEFNDFELEIPVQIREGSWEAYITELLTDKYWEIAGTYLASKYIGPALTEMAKKDFKDFGFSDLVKKTFKGITWVIKISKHLGSMSIKKIDEFLIIDKDRSNEIGILDKDGVELWIPVDALEFYKSCPETLFFKLAKNVEIERDLTVTYNDSIETISSTITSDSKPIFYKYKDTKETFFFPHLMHGDIVEIRGRLTRGNENANTFGLSYERHILTLIPAKGNITSKKEYIFTDCVVKGKVDRLNKTGTKLEKKPKIIFTEITPVSV